MFRVAVVEEFAHLVPLTFIAMTRGFFRLEIGTVPVFVALSALFGPPPASFPRLVVVRGCRRPVAQPHAVHGWSKSWH